MNILKKMIIKQIEKEYNENFKGFDVDNEMLDYLLLGVDDIHDKIVNFLLRNDNVDLKSSIHYDMAAHSMALSLTIFNNPISQEEIGDVTNYFTPDDIEKYKKGNIDQIGELNDM